MTLKTLCIFGTRPEAIKMAPLVIALDHDDFFESYICVTGQHKELLDQVLDFFSITPDYKLELMQKNQDLYDITANVLLSLRSVLRELKPDLVFVHGDTTTCFSAALAAFYEGIPVAHIEAGLRTGDLRAPFPEELNRTLVGNMASYHFCPTKKSKKNLLKQGVSEDNVWVTGNTVIDALNLTLNKISMADKWKEKIDKQLYGILSNPLRDLILVTGHRRENFGQGFQDLCQAIEVLARKYPKWDFVYPVHLNPNVRAPVYEILEDIANVHLIEPLDYQSFVWLMNSSDIILTDSGGIQEEAPALGKPVLVMRDVTERPEAIKAGTARLVGTSPEEIIYNVEDVMLNFEVYQKMSEAHNPYGDGKAVSRILASLKSIYSLDQRPQTHISQYEGSQLIVEH